MKKQEKVQNLTLNRETLRTLNDKVLESIAGGCDGMPLTCRCTFA